MASGNVPTTVGYKDTIYPYARTLGRGGTSIVCLYGSEALGYLTLKISYCNDPRAATKSQEELTALTKALEATPCSAASMYWRRRRPATEPPLRPAELLRAPLAWMNQGGCFYQVLDYYESNLAQWLSKTVERTAEQVQGIFLQVVSMVACLREKGLYYNDLKPSNLLVKVKAGDPVPAIVIGDLGGLDSRGDPRITVTPTRLPPDMLKRLSWKNIDVLTGFLVGELIFQLLFRPTPLTHRHPMNDFLRCLQEDGASSAPSSLDRCTDAHLLQTLEQNLAPNLRLSDPRIRDLAALGLNLLGYRGWFIPLSAGLLLKSDAWS